MKEIVIIVVILIIILGGAIYIQSFLNTTSDNLVVKLEDLKTNIEEENINKEELSKKTDDIYNEWKSINKKWSVVVLHSEIDSIETSLIKMKSKIKTNYLKESIEDLDTTIFLLQHIKEKEKTSLKNIF